MKQILLNYSLPKEIIEAIMMLYKNTKVKVSLLDGDTDYFDIVLDVLQGDPVTPFLLIICLDYVLSMPVDLMKENYFILAKERSRRYPTQTITDADFADVKVLLANKPVQVESLLHSLGRAASGIGLHVNADKTEYICFNLRGNVSTLNGGPVKLVDKFTS